MALDAFYDPNLRLASLNNTGLMQFQTFDNSLAELDQYQNFPLLNTSSSINSPYTSSRVANFNIDPVPLYTNPPIGLNAMTSPLVTDFDPNLNFVEQTPLFTSNQNTSLAPNRSQVTRKKQQQKASNAKRLNSLPSEIIHDPVNVAQKLKKPRLDTNEETILGQSISQQSPETVQLQSIAQKHQIPGLVQQYMRRDGNQLEDSSSSPMCDVLVQPRNKPMSDQQRVVQGVYDVNQLEEVDCTARVMQYLCHLRLRPIDNNITYWRKFVEEYFAPGAKKRWCVSLYDKVLEDKSVIPKLDKDVWQCDMCGCRAGKGFEVVFDSLPRLTKLVYDSGVINELLFIDLPQAYRLPSGLMMLKYEKVVQESVYENFRVVHEGQLCIAFTRDSKILSWEFCAKRHELLVTRNLIMSQIVQAEQKYQNDINDYRSNGVMLQDSQVNRNRFQSVGSRIANALDFELVDDFGFSKRYTRCLQITEILQSMKDIMTFSRANQMGPVESSKLLYPELQNRDIQEKYLKYRDLSADKSIPTSHFVTTTTNGFSNMVKERFITASEEATVALLGYNNSNNNVAYQVPKSSSSRTSISFVENGTLSSLRPRDQNSEQRAIQKILQEMINNNNRTVNEDSARLFTRMPVSGNLMRGSSYSWAGLSTGFSGPTVREYSSMNDQV